MKDSLFLFHVVVTCIKLPLENKLNECILNISLSIGLPGFHPKVHNYTLAVCFVFFFCKKYFLKYSDSHICNGKFTLRK